MKRAFTYIIVLLLALGLYSCELIVDVITDDSEGTYEYEIVQVPHLLSLHADMDIELVESGKNMLVFEGPEALLDKLEIEQHNGHLEIDYKKMGGWMYDKPRVKVFLPSICKINLYYDNELTAQDTLHSSVIKIHSEGNGDIHLNVNCDSLFVFGDNISDFYIAGKTKYLEAETALACSFYGSELIANKVKSNIAGSNNQFVFPIELLECNISQTGNVYYLNKPHQIVENRIANGSGKVIDSTNNK
jgi:hypothetical protein